MEQISTPVLQVKDIEVSFGDTRILRGVSFDLQAGETLGVVGESGCGKSMTSLAIMGMLTYPGRITKGSIKLEGRELVGLRESEMRQIRGGQIALVMQDPFTSLNPMMRIGDQIAEAIRLHQPIGKAESIKLAVEMLKKVGVPAPADSARKYPHQMSGGQRQRVVIAIAFACKPKVLIADEPTTALDVTLQAQILRLLRELQEQEGTSILLISHDIGVIGSLAKRIAVFYAGRIVETGSSEQVLRQPAHPYTQALLRALPEKGRESLEAIAGQPPDFANLPQGCSFRPRCSKAFEECGVEPGLLQVSSTHQSACWLVQKTSETSLDKA